MLALNAAGRGSKPPSGQSRFLKMVRDTALLENGTYGRDMEVKDIVLPDGQVFTL